jgi:hypothetical protein
MSQGKKAMGYGLLAAQAQEHSAAVEEIRRVPEQAN